MKNYIIILIISLMASVQVTFAQGSGSLMVSGTVMDEKGEELIGVSVVVKGTTNKGTITDIDGKFRLSNLSKKSTLVFSYIGFEPTQYVVTSSRDRVKIVLKESVSALDEVIVVGRDTQRKVSVLGAITSIDPASLNAPAASVSNMLGGRVPGIISVTRSGEPGNDFSEFWIRGISTFGANQSALVLVDGVEGNLNDLDPADIESFSVLKDASATAVYGVRGANGVVVVTTNRGKAGKLNINFKTNATLSYSARQPKYVNAMTYAGLANEARMARGYAPKYSETELSLFESGLDPDLYPNVNWRDVILKDHTWNNQHYLSASGGGSSARYFFSVGVQNKDAIFNQDPSANTYDTNVQYHKYTFRTNIDANLTKTTTLSLGIDQTIVNQNAPGYGDNNGALWSAQANLTPVTLPVKYSNGQLPSYGKNADQYSPYVMLNHTGYKEINRNSSKLNVSLRQELDFITKGLSIQGLFSFTNNGLHNIFRRKNPDLFFASDRLSDGSLNTKIKVTKQDIGYAAYRELDRTYYYEGRGDYKRSFGVHRVSALLHYYMQSFSSSSAYNAIASIPKRYQALSARATYSYDDTYLIEANVGYTGSENFRPGEQFGVFPAISLGWTPSRYDWVKNNLPVISYLKLRGSAGMVGNDRISNDKRFPYLTTISGTGGGWGMGGGLTEAEVGADNLTWETAKKYNVGIDLQLFDNRLEWTTDIFRDERTGIFQKRESIPEEGGLVNLPWANVGSMESEGIDGNISYTHSFAKDFSLTLRGNYTFTRNHVTNWEQPDVRYPYQSYSGVPYGVLRGLISLGLFKDEADIARSPKQTYEKEVLPGDIKYKDVNGDGKIDDDDRVPISYSDKPQIQYGFAAEVRYKGWTLSAFFEGTGKANFFYGGSGYYPFAWGETGNVLDIVADQNNRWTPASISGNISTENPNARFPRMTYGENKNNNRQSTFWLADASYLRFKNLDLSYRWTNNWLKNTVGMQALTISFIGDNLACWDVVKLWDPGQASGNGSQYPLQRTFTLQLNVQF